MSQRHCPTEDELVRFVDADLPPETTCRVELHAAGCSHCSRQIAGFRSLIEDLAAKPEDATLSPVDVSKHVKDVMRRVKSSTVERDRRSRRPWAAWSSGLAVAAALALFVGSQGSEWLRGKYAARGSTGSSSLSRDVGVQLYAQTKALKPLGPGDRVARTSAFLMGTRNTGHAPAFVMHFAVDSGGAVHWIAPAYSVEGTDPTAYEVRPSKDEQLAPTSVVFDDLLAGPLRVISLITAEPTKVSQIEHLQQEELVAERLMKRFPKSEVRQMALQVTP